jgi:GntR family transcriptional regulator/MocR family aminotransferase
VPDGRRAAHTTPPQAWWEAPYPFITGQSDPQLFPTHAWLKAVRRAHDPEHLVWSLGEHGGDDPLLVEQICGRIMTIRGVACSPDQVLITMGSQHALSLIAQVLADQHAQVVVEDPGYPDARQILGARGATVRTAGVDSSGLIVDEIPPETDVVYVTPSHQHPTNVTMSHERRIGLLDFAGKHDLTIIEDDYDSELRYRGAPSPALLSLDSSGRTIYLGTFSKFLAPGLRIGFVVADNRLITELRDLLRLTIRQVPGVIQRALGIFLRGGDYARALARQRAELGKRWELLQTVIQEELGWAGSYPAGGTSLWTHAPDPVDWRDVAREARPRGVLLQPPAEHWATPAARLRHLRLGFAAMPLNRIPAGIHELALAYHAVARRVS